MRVSKSGKGLVVRVSTSRVEALGLKEGDEVELHVTQQPDGETEHNSSRDNLIQRLRAFRGKLPADFKFDRDEAQRR